MRHLLIIGGGNMGFAIASGLVKKHIYNKTNIHFVESNKTRNKFLLKQKYQSFLNLRKLREKDMLQYEAVIIAVKPCDIKFVLKTISNVLKDNTLIISIAAGVKINTIACFLSKRQPIARVMPNTPCQIGEGMAVLTFNKNANKKHRQITKKIFSSLGKVIELSEDKFDLVTALSGSGPAYFCYLIECLARAGEDLGINKITASKLSLQTGIGTMLMLLKTKLTPASLRKIVTSPKGTTEAALNTLKSKKFDSIVLGAIRQAKERAYKLSKTCIVLLLSLSLFFNSFCPIICQEPIQLSTETEDISLTDDLETARRQVLKYPENPEAHFNLAIALSRTSQVENAIKELRKTKILIRKPENSEVLDKKINEYKQMLKDDPNAHNIRYRLAFSHYLKAYFLSKEKEKKEKGNKKKNQGLNLFGSKILSVKKDDSIITENLKLSDFYFNDLLKRNPKDIWAKVYYAFILAEQFEDYSKAREIWFNALKQDPNNPAPHFFLGELLLKDGNLKEGLLEISKAVLLRSQGF